MSLVLFASLSCCYCNVMQMREDPLMKTDINLIGADKSLMSTYQGNNVVINTNKMIAQAALANSAPDIEEDLDDPFVTTGSGKPRPVFKIGKEADEWINDLPKTSLNVMNNQSLSRVKRCGGGNNDDDDGANRARRARRRAARRAARRRAAKARKARKAARKAAKKATKTTQTTVTTKVIQNGQVVSETTGAQPAATTVTTTQQQVQQPQVVQTTTTQQVQQPQVVQTTTNQQQQPPAAG